MDKMMMKKMLGKQDEEGSDIKKEAKLSVLKELRKMASDMMGNDLSTGMKKVTVAAPDKEGLKHGLEKAEDLMESMPGEEEEMSDECDDMSDDELDAQIAKLQEAKQKKMMK